MLKDALSEYEKKFNKIVPENITIELSGDGVAACRGSNTSYFTTWIRLGICS